MLASNGSGEQITGLYLPLLAVDTHRGTSPQNIVDLLGTVMRVQANGGARGNKDKFDAVQVPVKVHAIDQLLPGADATAPKQLAGRAGVERIV